jgi:hypothetical protein
MAARSGVKESARDEVLRSGERRQVTRKAVEGMLEERIVDGAWARVAAVEAVEEMAG